LCSISAEQVRSGVLSKAKFAKAASALGVDVGALSAAVNVLAHVLLECARRNATEADLITSVGGADELGLSDEGKAVLSSCYATHARDLRSLLSDLSLRLPHYQNAEWRLDVSLGSRLCRAQLSPTLLLQLETRDAHDQPHAHLLQLDYANLDHLVAELEAAVKEANTKHARRIIRYVK
jgi:hypothetical protein